jgi:5-methylcytosine-specific restriction endonuclease McrA
MKPTSKREWYQKHYLRSLRWRQTRNLYLRRVGWLCERYCGRRACVVHHLSYENLGHEQPDQLIALCFECHREMHDWPKPANDNQLMLALERPKAS